MGEALEFLKKLDKGGAIVASNLCTPNEIAVAKTNGRYWSDHDGFGYVLRTSEWRYGAEQALDVLRTGNLIVVGDAG